MSIAEQFETLNMGRSLESGTLQTVFSPQNPTDSILAGVTQSSADTSEIADKLQILHLGDHGEATNVTADRKSDGIQRRPRKVKAIRVRRRRVSLQVLPVLGYLRGFLQSCTYMARSASTAAFRMDSRLLRSKLGLRLAQLHFSSKRARRIHSVQGSYKSDEQAQPLLHSNSPVPEVW